MSDLPLKAHWLAHVPEFLSEDELSAIGRRRINYLIIANDGSAIPQDYAQYALICDSGRLLLGVMTMLATCDPEQRRAEALLVSKVLYINTDLTNAGACDGSLMTPDEQRQTAKRIVASWVRLKQLELLNELDTDEAIRLEEAYDAIWAGELD